jgi:RNA polymerase primary sigma factor
MDGKNEFREGLFPSGSCVAPDDNLEVEIQTTPTYELFKEIDHGDITSTKLLLASEACKTCVQFSYCNDQRENIATELWRRGTGMAVIGGKELKATVQPNRSAVETETQAFTFDLARIPDEPQAALSILRQARRSEQLQPSGRARGALEAGATYLNWFKEQAPDQFAEISEKLGEGEMAKGTQDLMVALFQQKDFANFSAGVSVGVRGRGKNRYNPDRITEDDYPKVTQFLADAVAIKELGYSAPTRKAIVHSPTFYQELAATYQRGISWGDFNKIVSDRRDPVPALQRHQLQRATAREANPEAPEAYIKAAPRTHEKESLDERTEELADALKDHAFISKGLVRSMVISNPTDPREALHKLIERVEHATTVFDEDQTITSADVVRYARSHRSNDKLVSALTLFKNNIAALEKKYAYDPELTPKLIRKISDRHLNGAVAAAEKYKTCLGTLVTASDGTVPRTELRRAAENGITSFRDAQRAYMQRTINNRFMRRVDSRRPSMPILERMTYLYPRAEVEMAAESTHSLMNKGIVVSANAEATILHGEIPEDLYKIFSPKANEYLTFSSTVRSLSHLQRLVIAHEHGLMPLMYGSEANPLQLESLLNGKTITEYYYGTVIPLIGESTDDTPRALSLSEIVNDLTYYKQSLRTRDLDTTGEVLSLRNVRDATIIVGGHAVYLSEPEYEWDWDTNLPNFYPWLEQKISSVCAPHQREAAFEHARDAVQTGVLELLGDTPQDYRLVFSQNFYKDDITDLERAALANAMGIDQLLFGSNLATLLQQHLGDQSVSIALSRAPSPTIADISKDQLIQEARREAEEKAQTEADLLPIPDDPFDRLLTFTYGPQPNLAALSELDRMKITKTLLSVFSAHVRDAREHSDTILESQQEVFIAWSALEGNSLERAANTYGLAHNQIDSAIDRGLEIIGSIFAELQNQRLRDIRATLEQVGTFPTPDFGAIPVETPEPKPQPTNETDTAAAESAPENVFVLDDYRQKTERTTVGALALQQELTVVVEPSVKPQRAAEQMRTDDDASAQIPGHINEDTISDSILRQYITIAQQYPRLSMKEGIACATVVQTGIAARNALDEGTVAAHQRAAYEQRVADGEAAKMRLVHGSLQTVIHVALKYPEHPAISTVDYIQEGNIGLLEAAERFKPEAQVPFSAYATFYIKKNMVLARNRLGHAASVEDFAARNASRYRLFEFEFRGEHGREPTQEETLQRFGWSAKQYEKAMQINIAPASLNKPVGLADGQSGSEFGDYLLAEKNEQLVARSALSYLVRTAFGDSGLERRQALTLTLLSGLELHPGIIDKDTIIKYGIEEGRTYTPKEIASLFGFSHQSVSRFRRQAIETLSQTAVKDQLAYLLNETDVPY